MYHIAKAIIAIGRLAFKVCQICLQTHIMLTRRKAVDDVPAKYSSLRDIALEFLREIESRGEDSRPAMETARVRAVLRSTLGLVPQALELITHYLSSSRPSEYHSWWRPLLYLFDLQKDWQ